MKKKNSTASFNKKKYSKCKEKKTNKRNHHCINLDPYAMNLFRNNNRKKN